jgi:uncharacterized protein YegP (UPF0339 family)
MGKFEVFRDISGEWRWRLWAGDIGEIIASSADGYTDKADCERGITLVKEHAPGAEIAELEDK